METRNYLVSGPEGETALRRPGARQDDNIKMDQKEEGRGMAGLIWLCWDRWRDFVQAVVKRPFPQNALNFFTGRGAINPLQGLCPRSYLTSVPLILN